MSEEKDHWKAFVEEIEVAGHQLVEKVTQLIKDGNVRLLRVKSEKGDVFLEIPLTVGAVGGGVVALAAPWLAILGGLAVLLTRVKIEVVRTDAPPEGEAGKPDSKPEPETIDL